MRVGAGHLYSSRGDRRTRYQPELLRAVRVGDHVYRARLIATDTLYRLVGSDQQFRIAPYDC